MAAGGGKMTCLIELAVSAYLLAAIIWLIHWQ